MASQSAFESEQIPITSHCVWVKVGSELWRPAIILKRDNTNKATFDRKTHRMIRWSGDKHDRMKEIVSTKSIIAWDSLDAEDIQEQVRATKLYKDWHWDEGVDWNNRIWDDLESRVSVCVIKEQIPITSQCVWVNTRLSSSRRWRPAIILDSDNSDSVCFDRHKHIMVRWAKNMHYSSKELVLRCTVIAWNRLLTTSIDLMKVFDSSVHWNDKMWCNLRDRHSDRVLEFSVCDFHFKQKKKKNYFNHIVGILQEQVLWPLRA